MVNSVFQKVHGWGEVVKRLWDEERRTRGNVLPILLGSAALPVQKGLTGSLSSRFFLHRCPHLVVARVPQGGDLRGVARASQCGTGCGAAFSRFVH